MSSGDAAFKGIVAGVGADRATSSREARDRGEVRDKPERSMGACSFVVNSVVLSMPLDAFHIFWRQMTLAYCATNSIFNQCLSHVYGSFLSRAFLCWPEW